MTYSVLMLKVTAKRTYVGKANSAWSDETKSNLRLNTTVLVVIGESD